MKITSGGHGATGSVAAEPLPLRGFRRRAVSFDEAAQTHSPPIARAP
jgi:hypothetical protein